DGAVPRTAGPPALTPGRIPASPIRTVGWVWAFRPMTRPAAAAAASPAGRATSETRRHARRRRRAGPSAVAAITPPPAHRSGGAVGLAARRDSGDIALHLLLQACERAGEARRARRLADPQHPGRRPPVELEQHAERDHLALARAERRERALERGREAVA